MSHTTIRLDYFFGQWLKRSVPPPAGTDCLEPIVVPFELPFLSASDAFFNFATAPSRLRQRKSWVDLEIKCCNLRSKRLQTFSSENVVARRGCIVADINSAFKTMTATFIPDTDKAITTGSQPNASRSVNLDLIRAGACSLVIWSHCSELVLRGGYPLGPYAVCAFCVLSGFLIMTSLVREEQCGKPIDIGQFLFRRFFRITAPYLVATICTTGVALTLCKLTHINTFSDSSLLSEAGPLLTLTHNYVCGGIFSPLWSITIEEQFYCVIPILLVVIRTSIFRKLLFVGTALTLFPITLLGGNNALYVNGAFIALMGGCLLASSYKHTVLQLATLESRILAALVVTVLLSLNITLGLSPYSYCSVVAFALLIVIALRSLWQLPLKNLLAHVGQVSYVMYLIHMPFIYFWKKVLLTLRFPSEGALLFLLTLLSSACVAHFSWHLVERRLVEWAKTIKFAGPLRAFAFLTPALIAIGLVRLMLR